MLVEETVQGDPEPAQTGEVSVEGTGCDLGPGPDQRRYCREDYQRHPMHTGKLRVALGRRAGGSPVCAAHGHSVALQAVSHAYKLRRQEQLIEQVQEALEARIVIEQAQGITFEQN